MVKQVLCIALAVIACCTDPTRSEFPDSSFNSAVYPPPTLEDSYISAYVPTWGRYWSYSNQVEGADITLENAISPYVDDNGISFMFLGNGREHDGVTWMLPSVPETTPYAVTWHEPGALIYAEDLKQTHPNSTYTLVLGGWTHESRELPHLCASMGTAFDIFIKSVADLLDLGYDNFEFDWEYPAYAAHGGRPSDKECYPDLLMQTKRYLAQYNAGKGRPAPKISLAVGVGPHILEPGFDLEKIYEAVDFVRLMTYDLYGYWPSLNDASKVIVGPNAPYNPIPNGELGFSVKEALDNIVSPDPVTRVPKTIVGLGGYGRSIGIGAKVDVSSGEVLPFAESAPHIMDPFSMDYATMSQRSLKALVANDPTILAASRYIDEGRAAEVILGKDGVHQYIGYDDACTIYNKVVTISKAYGINKYMLWSSLDDDFDNQHDVVPHRLSKCMKLGLEDAVNDDAKHVGACCLGDAPFATDEYAGSEQYECSQSDKDYLAASGFYVGKCLVAGELVPTLFTACPGDCVGAYPEEEHPTPPPVPETNTPEALCAAAETRFVADPNDLGYYYDCGSVSLPRMPCPVGLIFKNDLQICDYPWGVYMSSKPKVNRS